MNAACRRFAYIEGVIAGLPSLIEGRTWSATSSI